MKNQKPNNLNPQMQDYIDSQVAEGVPQIKIKQNLIETGWTAEQLEPLFTSLQTAQVDVHESTSKIKPVVLVGAIFLLLTLFSVITYLMYGSVPDANVANDSVVTDGVITEPASCPLVEFYFDEAAQLAENQIYNGPLDEFWQCSGYEECELKSHEQRTDGRYDKALSVFLAYAQFINDTIEPVALWSYPGDYDDDEIQSVDAVAKQLLTPETYALEKTGRFSNFIPFIFSYINLYTDVEAMQEKATAYTPLTEEEKALVDAEIQRTGMLPDPNDQRFDFLRNQPIGFDENMKVISLEKYEIDLQILLMNENRVAVNLGEWYLTAIFDLVSDGDCWKIDLIEPYRPDEKKNPRIFATGMRMSALEMYWKQLEALVKLAQTDTPLYFEFKGWWDEADVEARKAFVLGSSSEASLENVPDSIVTQLSYSLFSNVAPEEIDGGLRYEPVESRVELIINRPFLVFKKDGEWAIEYE